MRFIFAQDYMDASRRAYDFVRSALIINSSLTLGLATGSTPIQLYKLMIDDYKRGNFSYSSVKTINLDEYVGLPSNHPQSYRYFMNSNLFNHIDINIDNTKVPNGNAPDLDNECLSYSKYVDENRIEIQILGIGSNGHIAFNEPGTSFNSITHIVNLKESTINDNSRFFENTSMVPKQAITMGIQDILKAKMIILIATGSSKADSLYKAIMGPVSEDCPASILQTHKNTVILADQAASFWVKKNHISH